MLSSTLCCFVSRYSAAAVITHEPGMCIPYLDKFVVKRDHQVVCLVKIVWFRNILNHAHLFVLKCWYGIDSKHEGGVKLNM